MALCTCGMSQRDITDQIKSLYDVEISPELVTKISEKIIPEVVAWQNRLLERVYPFISIPWRVGRTYWASGLESMRAVNPS